jgi:hypothetical protein
VLLVAATALTTTVEAVVACGGSKLAVEALFICRETVVVVVVGPSAEPIGIDSVVDDADAVVGDGLVISVLALLLPFVFAAAAVGVEGVRQANEQTLILKLDTEKERVRLKSEKHRHAAVGCSVSQSC